MVTAPEKSIKELAETEAIIEEFKQRLTRTFLKEKEKLYELADRESKHLLADAYNESCRFTQKAQQDAEAIVDQAKEMAAKATENALLQASSQAERIIKEAEDKIRKEARERSSKEVTAILRKTTEDSAKQTEKILQAAREQAEQVSKQIQAEAENNADELMRSASDLHIKAAEELSTVQKKATETVEQMITAARQTAQVQAEKETQLIIARAKTAAEKEKEYVLASALTEARISATAEAEVILAAARNNAEDIINQAKNKVRSQIEESSRLMQEINQKMQQVMAVPEGKLQGNNQAEINTTKEDKVNIISASPQPAVHKVDLDVPKEDSLPAGGGRSTINSPLSVNEEITQRGTVKIDIAPPSDNEQIKALEKELLQNNGLRIISKGGEEDGSSWLEVHIENPLPLVEFLRKSPYVISVVGAKSYIIVSLKSK